MRISLCNGTETLTYEHRTGQALPANMSDLHYYALAIISYQNIAGPRCKVSDVVWVVYEYRDGEMIAGKTVRGEEEQRGDRERRLSNLCPRHAYICANIHAVRFIFSWCSSSRTIRMCTSACERVCTCGPSFDLMFARVQRSLAL